MILTSYGLGSTWVVRRSIYSYLEKEGMNTKSDSKQVVRTLGQRLTIMAILGLVVITVLFGINQIVQKAANVPLVMDKVQVQEPLPKMFLSGLKPVNTTSTAA